MTIAAAQAARTEKLLAEPVRYNGQVMTRRERVRSLQERGAEFSAHEVPRVKDMTSRALFRSNNAQQAAHRRRQKEAGTRTEYRATLPDGCFVALTKTQYAHALRSSI